MTSGSRGRKKQPKEKHPITLGSAAVEMFVRTQSEGQLHALLGIDRGPGRKRIKRWHALIRDRIAFCANCYRGGRNETFAVGYHTGHATDIDLSGAYTTAMVAIFYPDWDGTIESKDLDVLARENALAIACVSFRFPSTTRYPSLPVDSGDHGLIYPLAGISYCTGAEMRVALDQGADLVVLNGLHVPWANDERPFLEFTKHIVKTRKAHPKGSLPERLAKEVGNSLYGKVAQGVADMRGDLGGSGKSRYFSSREGKMEELGPSNVTQPLLAAFITGLVRAVLSELLARLPADVDLLSATTDGFLSTASLDRLDISGPLMTLYGRMRELATGDPTSVEVKGEAAEILAMKTRGALAISPFDPANPGKPILARAGVKFEKKPADPWEECRMLEGIYRDRSYDLKLTQRRMINLRLQWETESDLVDEDQDVRVNLDYDLKRRPVNVTDAKGLFWCTTSPWQTVEEFFEYRDAFEIWRATRKRVLRTAQDWADFLEHKRAAAAMAEVGARTSKRTPAMQLFLRCYAHGLEGLPGKDFAVVAELISKHGMPTTVQNVKDAKRRGVPSLGVISSISDTDRAILKEAERRWPGFDHSVLLRAKAVKLPGDLDRNRPEPASTATDIKRVEHDTPKGPMST